MNQWNNPLYNVGGPADEYYRKPRPYRLVFPNGDHSKFASFDEALGYLSFCKQVKAVALINDNRADGGKQQGLTEDEYQRWLEVCS